MMKDKFREYSWLFVFPGLPIVAMTVILVGFLYFWNEMHESARAEWDKSIQEIRLQETLEVDSTISVDSGCCL